MPHYPTPAEFQPGPKPRLTSVELLDLSIARTNVQKYLPGDWVQFLDGAGNLQIQMDSFIEPKRTLRRGGVLYGPFDTLFITNEAQTDSDALEVTLPVDQYVISTTRCVLLVGSFPSRPVPVNLSPHITRVSPSNPAAGASVDVTLGSFRNRLRLHAIKGLFVADANVASRQLRWALQNSNTQVVYTSANVAEGRWPNTILASEACRFSASIGMTPDAYTRGDGTLMRHAHLADLPFIDGGFRIFVFVDRIQAGDQFSLITLFFELN